MRLLITFLATPGMNPGPVSSAVSGWLKRRHSLGASFAPDPEAEFIWAAVVEVSEWEAEEKRDAIAWYLDGRDEIDHCRVVLLGELPQATPVTPLGRRHRRSPLAERLERCRPAIAAV